MLLRYVAHLARPSITWLNLCLLDEIETSYQISYFHSSLLQQGISGLPYPISCEAWGLGVCTYDDSFKAAQGNFPQCWLCGSEACCWFA